VSSRTTSATRSSRRPSSTEGPEKELADVRAEQKRLARAVATAGDDIPELAAELRLRHDRIRRLEADLASAWRTPAAVGDLLARAEEAAHQKLADLRKSLDGDLPTLRAALRALFPEGLAFRRAENTNRRVWAISFAPRGVRLSPAQSPGPADEQITLAPDDAWPNLGRTR
jgi:hypothetical protein